MGDDDAVAWFRALPLLPHAGWARYASRRSGARLRLTVIAPACAARPPHSGPWRRYADPYRSGRWTWGLELVVAPDDRVPLLT